MNPGSHVNGSTPDEIEADIERQRDELSDTVSALQKKLDVKARAKDKAAVLKDRMTTDSGRPRPDLAAVGFLALAAAIGFVTWRRTR